MLFVDLWLLIAMGFVTGSTITTSLIIYADCLRLTREGKSWPGMFTTPYVLGLVGLVLGFVCFTQVNNQYENIIKAIS